MVGIAGALLILGVAMNAMQGAILGAVAIGIAAAALLVLVEVVKGFAGISWEDLLRGMAGIAIALATLAISALLIQPAIPALLALGAALLLIGAGFALFGLGASLVASAFELLARAGKAGSETLVVALENIGKAIPALAKGFAEGILELIMILGKAAPVIVKVLVEILQHLLEGLGKLIPEVVNVIGVLVTSLLEYIVTVYPKFIQAGIALIMALLTGIRDAIGPIVTVVGEIITNFLNALAAQLGPIIEAGVNLIVAFLQGLTSGIPRIIDAVVTLIVTIINELSNQQNVIIAAGLDLLLNFLKGISENLNKVITAATDVVIEFIKGITDNLFRLASAATDVVVKFCEELGNNVNRVVDAGGNLIIKLIEGFGNKAGEVISAGVTAVEKFLEGLGQNAVRLANAAGDFIVDLLGAIEAAIRTYSGEIRSAGLGIAEAIVDGMSFGLESKAKSVATSAWNLAKGALDKAKEAVDAKSPSKEFYKLGQDIAAGLSIALNGDTSVEAASVGLVDRATDVFTESFARMTEQLGEMTEFNPTITPVLDLTRVAAGAQQISDYIATSATLAPDYSYTQARTIATTANAQQSEAIQAPAGAGEVTFNQVINSPTQLSTSDIYKNTRNQITMAKQELSIP
jgi:hypothetical protein